ncbi:hypothetical protein GUITHDRAFT_99740 [Guillardia theta CCMP2712]|uniref:Uncharacterized protein n=1 Tax=Guillardia theta (strain CCMP2712) TaxID=905079 RepID=L1K3R4_GUITC|nr:hypothetical protein GUITHDRAFT_99740 [Guillardia theta CCMP2712]EKX55110.1 hypothetical protein GUITHDRAFT_99740 [Guillardia theta CCMP2712]|eukprot:XP_005842090.1 hypothetical protein GUITHDRAFT_99740 [Guillardia theta CCMP2712]
MLASKIDKEIFREQSMKKVRIPGTNQRRMKRMMTPRTKTLRLTVRTRRITRRETRRITRRTSRRITRRMSRRKKRKKRKKKSLMKYYSLQDYLEIASSKLPSQQSSKWSSDSCTELWPSWDMGRVSINLFFIMRSFSCLLIHTVTRYPKANFKRRAKTLMNTSATETTTYCNMISMEKARGAVQLGKAVDDDEQAVDDEIAADHSKVGFDEILSLSIFAILTATVQFTLSFWLMYDWPGITNWFVFNKCESISYISENIELNKGTASIMVISNDCTELGHTRHHVELRGSIHSGWRD